MSDIRDDKGRLKKGVVLNPGGRPKMPEEVRRAAQEHTLDAINTLAEIMKNVEANDNARIKACEVLLNRGWGTPVQSVEIGGPDGQPLGPSLVTVKFADA